MLWDTLYSKDTLGFFICIIGAIFIIKIAYSKIWHKDD